jgi:hypothetical protein
MIDLEKILLAHFQREGLTVYRSAERVKLEKRHSIDDVEPTMGQVISVTMPNFRVDAFVDEEIKSLLCSECSETGITSPEDAENLIGLNAQAKAKIRSWERARSWKQGEPVESDWHFIVEVYIYSDCTWNDDGTIDCNEEVFIPGENVIQVTLDYTKDFVVITFKDLEGYIQKIKQDL